MTNRNTDSSSQGDDRGVPPLAPSGNLEQMQCRAGNTILKSGPLSLSSKGIGWTSWKKRWFILTRTSLVFFRSDPSVIPQKGSEVNLTLGGIDLNNSGSVVVKDDKKLLTVHFPDGRDGRAFTLKAETLEDLHEWKAALETALSQAPSSAPPLEQNGILKNDQNDAANNTHEEMKDRKPVKSIVVGRPILLALEDIDGTPSFLEKALRFIEMHGVKVEGILRQAADVDDVEQRVQEYEQGKNEFSVGEDAHVVADCVKHVLRELPSSPVPASCCNALLEACRTDRGTRVNAMRSAICETFPEPNRRLLQRILMMMQTVASHKNENRMSSSAVAACMAPLLLRPLLAGDCELENDFDLGGDGSVQLLQAAAAANHAQAIVITLLEEYDKIFGEGIISSELYSDSEESGSESEEATDDDESYEDDGHDDETNNSDAIDDDLEHASSRSYTDSSSGDDSSYDDKGSEDSRSSFKSPKAAEHFEHTQNFSLSSPQASTPRDDNKKKSEGSTYRSKTDTADGPEESNEFLGDSPGVTALLLHSDVQVPNSCMQKSSTIASVNMPGVGRRAVWGRTSAKKNLSMESINFEIEDEAEIEKLEATKRELHNRIAVEAKESEILKASLEQQKKALHGRRLALEQEVERLQKQLQKERDIRATLEAALNLSQGPMSISGTVNEKMKAEIEEITLAKAEVAKLKEKVDDLGHQLHNQREENYGSANDSYQRFQQSLDYQTEMKAKEKNGEPMATRHPFNRCTRSKDTFVDEAGSQNEKQVEARPSVPCLHNKQPPELQQLDSIHSGSSNFVGSLATSGAESVALKSPATTNNKRHGSKGEGTNSTTSTLTKLTNRLNFLKERRTHITNELHNMDKGRSLIQPAQNQEKVRAEALQSVPNMDKVQGLEAQSTSIPERSSRGMDNCNSLPHQCPMPTNLEKEERLEGGQWVPNLDRVKSEGHSSQKSERGRGSDGASSFPSRTHSR